MNGLHDPGFERAQRLLVEHQGRGREEDVTVLGREWIVLPDVFSPALTPVTALFTSWLPCPLGGTFLEIGCGAGVTAVTMAVRGCTRVWATDISPVAVENAQLNAIRHGVVDRMRFAASDLFSSLSSDVRFDVVYWNSNFVLPPPDFRNESALHHALFDPGYRAHQRFVTGVASRLAAGGRAFLGFSSLGSWPDLQSACADARVEPVVFRRRALVLPDGTSVEFQLVELVTAGDRLPSETYDQGENT